MSFNDCSFSIACFSFAVSAIFLVVFIYVTFSLPWDTISTSGASVLTYSDFQVLRLKFLRTGYVVTSFFESLGAQSGQ